MYIILVNEFDVDVHFQNSVLLMTSPTTAGHIQPFLSVKNPFSLTVDPTGGELQFKWQKDGKNLSDDSKYHYIDTDTLHIVEIANLNCQVFYADDYLLMCEQMQ